MKSLFLACLIVFIVILSSFKFQNNEIKDSNQSNVSKDEHLEFKVNYGFIPVGKARINTGINIHPINNIACYRIGIHIQTVGFIAWFKGVEDFWGAYLDTTSLLPLFAYRNIDENGKSEKEMVKFNHETDMAETKLILESSDLSKEPISFSIPHHTRELISGYSFLRDIDYSSLKIDDTLKINILFEGSIYDIKVFYRGKDIIDTDIGMVNSQKISSDFSDENFTKNIGSIAIWFSDDQNHIPLKMEAKRGMGSFSINIKSAENVKYPINFSK